MQGELELNKDKSLVHSMIASLYATISSCPVEIETSAQDSLTWANLTVLPVQALASLKQVQAILPSQQETLS